MRAVGISGLVGRNADQSAAWVKITARNGSTRTITSVMVKVKLDEIGTVAPGDFPGIPAGEPRNFVRNVPQPAAGPVPDDFFQTMVTIDFTMNGERWRRVGNREPTKL